jgi:hypothetical protein
MRLYVCMYASVQRNDYRNSRQQRWRACIPSGTLEWALKVRESRLPRTETRARAKTAATCVQYESSGLTHRCKRPTASAFGDWNLCGFIHTMCVRRRQRPCKKVCVCTNDATVSSWCLAYTHLILIYMPDSEKHCTHAIWLLVSLECSKNG